MQTDTYGQIIFDEKDLVDLYLRDPNKVLKNVLVSESINYNSDLDLTNIPSTKIYENLSISVEKFDDKNQ